MNNQFYYLLNSFVRKNGLVRFQIDSYNDFITRRIPKILSDIGSIKPEIEELGELEIKLGKFEIGGPIVREADGSVRSILPAEARIRNLTYAAPMYIEMTQILNGVESNPVMVNFGDMPVMLKSKICPLSKMDRNELIEAGEDPDDPGGYFIINGTERILVLVEEIATDRVIVEKTENANIPEIARIHSERDGYVQRHLLERKKSGEILISFANLNRFPVVVLLKALGLEKDKDLLTAISLDEEVQEAFLVNLYEYPIERKEDALEEIGKHIRIPQKQLRLKQGAKIIDRYLLPHIGQNPENRLEKAMFLVKAIEKLIKLHLGKIEDDDVDHYSNKRVKLAGDLLELLLRSILLGRWGLITRMNYNYQKLTKRGRLPPLPSIVEGNVLTNQIVSAIAIGSWIGGRTGVTQRLERGSYVKTVSHMRNVLSPLTSTQEHFEARELHPTHWGRLCPSETPEGATIGLRKYLAIMASITSGLDEKTANEIVKNISGYIKKNW